MADDPLAKSPQPEPPATPAKPDDAASTSVPQWLRTTIVAVMAAAFLAHIGYDAVTTDYDSFQTSFLILGFVGLALGIDLFGRR